MSLVPKFASDVLDGVAKSVAVGKKHDHGGDAPSHAQHGERGAAPVMAHRVIGFLEEVFSICSR